jgi:intracellular sulfur oxidation DsrE/DsrF family protein
MKRIAVLAALAVLLIGGTIAAQQEMSGSERYRAEKCAGQYTCDEDGAGADLWTRQQTMGTHRVSQLPEKSSGTPTNVQAFDDKQVLVGLNEIKVAFDITASDGKGLLSRLNVIDETRQSLIKQGVKPNCVLAFRGPATKLVQTDIEKVKPEDRAELAKIAAKIKEMSTTPGVQALEQCSVAIRQQGTAADKVLTPIKVVGNSWISLMAYQAKGYAYIAP